MFIRQLGEKVGRSMVSMDESWTLRNGLEIPHRSVLAAMTNKQSYDDGCLSDEEINFLISEIKLNLFDYEKIN